MSDTEFHAAQRVRLNQVHKLPANPTLRQLTLEFADHLWRHHPLEQPPHCAWESHIHLRQTQFNIAVGALFRQVHIIDPHDLPATCIDDLLVEQVFLDCQPGFIGPIEFERALADIQLNLPRRHRSDLVVFCDQRWKVSARQEEMRDAIRRLRRFNKELADPPDEIALRIVSL